MEPSQEQPVHLVPEKKPFLTMPMAVVIAGGLIAGSIIAIGWQGAAGTSNAAAVADSGLYPLSPEPDKKSLAVIAGKIGIDKAAFEKCIAEKTGSDRVDADITSAMELGVTGTPASYIISKDGQKIEISGAQPLALMRATIDGLLAGTKSKDSNPKMKIPPITDSDHVYGNAETASIVIYEYSDFECPFCKMFHPTMYDVIKAYDGKVAWVYRHFPLEQIHPSARIKAEASECAARIGGNEAFWKFTDLMLTIKR